MTIYIGDQPPSLEKLEKNTNQARMTRIGPADIAAMERKARRLAADLGKRRPEKAAKKPAAQAQAEKAQPTPARAFPEACKGKPDKSTFTGLLHLAAHAVTGRCVKLVMCYDNDILGAALGRYQRMSDGSINIFLAANLPQDEIFSTWAHECGHVTAYDFSGDLSEAAADNFAAGWLAFANTHGWEYGKTGQTGVENKLTTLIEGWKGI